MKQIIRSILLIATLVALPNAHAVDKVTSTSGSEQFPSTATGRTIDIYSATDTIAITPVIRAFEHSHPTIHVRYHEYESTELYDALRQGKIKEADVVISSAMDLQVKLANDGFAQRLSVTDQSKLPLWSNWRHEAYGFTFEPVVIAYNKAAFKGKQVPHSHEALVNALRNELKRYSGKVGTYDVRLSGAGYFLATQDEVASSIAGRMQESLARAHARIYCCTSKILDDLGSGKLMLGYNLLGSYALARARMDNRIGVILPEDYTLVMSRIALVPKIARDFEAAQTFVNYLLSNQGQQVIATHSELIALRQDVSGPFSINAISKNYQLRYTPIKVGLSLLTYQDKMKRDRFIREWSQLFVPH